MRAMQIEAFGDPSTLALVDRPDPVPGPSEVLIEVHAAACNFFDILIVQGRYQRRPELPFGPGAEVGGVVRQVGGDVRDFAPGDRVLALLDWGGYATKVCADARRTFRIPSAMSWEDAAAFGIVYQTSYIALVERARLASGEFLLVHAAAGGVGLAAVQIGRALGATVIATASSKDKLEIAKAHGAHHVIDYSEVGWHEKVLEITAGRGADVIYDPVGGDVFDMSLKCVAFSGRVLVIGFASGRIPSVPANRILLKNIAIVGLHWGAYVDQAPERIQQAMNDLFALYERGAVKPLVSKVYPFSQATEALADLAARKSVGKLVLHVDSESPSHVAPRT